MKNIFTKTIIMIVFVVFLGLVNTSSVDAANFYCIYRDRGIEIVVPIEGPRIPVLDITNENGSQMNYRVRNWNQSAPRGPNYTANNQAMAGFCPERMFFVSRHDGPNHIYFSDLASAPMMQDYLRNMYRPPSGVTLLQDVRRTTEEPGRSVVNIATVNPDLVSPIPDGIVSYSCGDGFIKGLPSNSLRFARYTYLFLQVVVPILLIILGSIDFAKAVASQKEDEIKKGQSSFFKRLITAAMIFLLLLIIRLVVGMAGDNSARILQCMNCFLRGAEYCD